MILVTGITGHLGKAVLNHLLKKVEPQELAALARNREKSLWAKAKGVDVKLADYNDYSSLVRAFTGVDKVYFVSGNDVLKRDQQHINIIAAAKECGVKHVVYTSFQRANDDPESPIAFATRCHWQTEKLLVGSGLTYTILRHALYMDGLPMFLGEKVLKSGTIFLPAGTGKAAFAMRSELAEAGANVLLTEGHENKVYELSGPDAYSFDHIANILSDISGKIIRYVSPSVDSFKQELSTTGTSAQIISVVAGFSDGIKQGEFSSTGPALEILLGRKPMDIRDFLTNVYMR